MKHEFKPRRTLRLENFLRFEEVLAKGCMGSIIVNPRTENLNLRAETLAYLLGEARLGYIRYNYPSTLIPHGYQMSRLRFRVLADDTVLIENSAEDSKKGASSPTEKLGAIPSTSKAAILEKLKASPNSDIFAECKSEQELKEMRELKKDYPNLNIIRGPGL